MKAQNGRRMTARDGVVRGRDARDLVRRRPSAPGEKEHQQSEDAEPVPGLREAKTQEERHHRSRDDDAEADAGEDHAARRPLREPGTSGRAIGAASTIKTAPAKPERKPPGEEPGKAQGMGAGEEGGDRDAHHAPQQQDRRQARGEAAGQQGAREIAGEIDGAEIGGLGRREPAP